MPVMEEQAHLLTPKEIADTYHVHINTVYRWIDKGLKVQRPGGHGHYRIQEDDLKRFLAISDQQQEAVNQ